MIFLPGVDSSLRFQQRGHSCRCSSAAPCAELAGKWDTCARPEDIWACTVARLASPSRKPRCTSAQSSSQGRNASRPQGGLICRRRVAPEAETGSRQREELLGSQPLKASRQVLAGLQEHEWLQRRHRLSRVKASEWLLRSQQGRRWHPRTQPHDNLDRRVQAPSKEVEDGLLRSSRVARR